MVGETRRPFRDDPIHSGITAFNNRQRNAAIRLSDADDPDAENIVAMAAIENKHESSAYTDELMEYANSNPEFVRKGKHDA